MAFKAPFLPYREIRPFAERFQNEYNTEGHIPVPIEEIIESKLKLSIVPFKNLKSGYDTEAFLTKDLRSLYIDEDIYMNERYEFRMRYTLAHEVGHLVLHRDIYEKTEIDSADEWIAFQNNSDSDQYSWFEKHAYDFAGLILVPSDQLLEGYRKGLHVLAENNYSFHTAAVEMVNSYICNPLSRQFLVSTEVIERRIKYDELKPNIVL